MTSDSNRFRFSVRPSTWLFNLLLWTFIAALQGLQSYTSSVSEGMKTDFMREFGIQVMTYYPWALLGPLLFEYFRRFPVERFASVRTLLFLPLVAASCIMLQIASHTWGMILFPYSAERARSFPQMYPEMLRWISLFSTLTFAAIVGVCHGINFYQQYRERERVASTLEKALSDARLQTLQMQIQPHFFFNTLHAIASLVRDRQNDAAVGMIARLSDLFRYTLTQAQTQTIPLRQELEFLSGYLEIERTRFPDRLRVEMQVAPEALDASVPTLILQPLVENAIKHGISHLSSQGVLRIVASVDGGRLELSVENDGPGLSTRWEEKNDAVGILNTRRRLEQLYGPLHHFELREGANHRVIAEMTIPLHKPSQNGNA